MEKYGTPVDSLKRGDWVAAVESDQHLKHCGEYGRADFNGRPMKILAISLPFLSVQVNGERIMAVDIRAVALTRLSKAYVNAMLGKQIKKNRNSYTRTTGRKRKKKLEPNICPRCECPMSQTFVMNKGWRWLCPECGHEGGEPPQNLTLGG